MSSFPPFWWILGLSLWIAITASAQSIYTVDLFVEPKQGELAAWQVELTFNPRELAVVSVEGGMPGTTPPRHDPKGFSKGRLILADLTLNPEGFPTDQPVAKLHVMANLHVMTNPSQSSEMPMAKDGGLSAKVVVAAKPGGEKIPTTLQLVPRMPENRLAAPAAAAVRAEAPDEAKEKLSKQKKEPKE